MLLEGPKFRGGGRAAGLNEFRLALFGEVAFLDPTVGLRVTGGWDNVRGVADGRFASGATWVASGVSEKLRDRRGSENVFAFGVGDFDTVLTMFSMPSPTPLAMCSAMAKRLLDSTAPADRGYSMPFGLRLLATGSCGETIATGRDSGEVVRACIWEADSLRTLPFESFLDVAGDFAGADASLTFRAEGWARELSLSSRQGEAFSTRL